MRSFINANFITFMNTFKQVRPSSYNLLHNKHRTIYLPPGEKTYDGFRHCGEMSVIVGNYLLDNGYDVQLMYKYERVDEFSFEDHNFIKISDIIIDPTYKQFFRNINDTSNDQFNDSNKVGYHYMNYLYEELDPIFVGTHNELCQLISKLNGAYYDQYKIKNHNANMWDNAKEYKLKSMSVF
jgi:hypothetical protein